MASCRSPLSARPWASRRGDCSGIAALAPPWRGHGGYWQSHDSVAARLPRRPWRARPAISAGRPAGIGPLGRICPRGGTTWQGRRGEPRRPEIGPPEAPGGGLRAWAITGQGAALRALWGMCPARGRKSGRFSRLAAPTGGLAGRGPRQGRPGGPTLAQNAPPGTPPGGGGATPCRGATKKALY